MKLNQLRKLIEEEIELLESRSEFDVNSNDVNKAYEYIKSEFEENDLDIDKEIPNFKENYKLLRNKLKQALGISRFDMPVINAKDKNRFQNDLSKGNIDIRKPYYKPNRYPKDLDKITGKQWLKHGKMDNNKNDDKIKVKEKRVEASKLKPTQNQIWLAKIIDNFLTFGAKIDESIPATIITSKEGYIIDGHHRFARTLLVNPNAKLKILYVPLSIKELLKMARSYGNAIGNVSKK